MESSGRHKIPKWYGQNLSLFVQIAKMKNCHYNIGVKILMMMSLLKKMMMRVLLKRKMKIWWKKQDMIEDCERKEIEKKLVDEICEEIEEM